LGLAIALRPAGDNQRYADEFEEGNLVGSYKLSFTAYFMSKVYNLTTEGTEVFAERRRDFARIIQQIINGTILLTTTIHQVSLCASLCFSSSEISVVKNIEA
jgi:hypothetical protein